MAKKILSAILALILVFSMLPVSSLAWEVDQLVYLNAWQEDFRRLQVYDRGNDALMTPESIAWLSGFQVDVGERYVSFTRGAKTVKYDTQNDLIFLSGFNSALNAATASRQVDGVWYLSAASLLPWLNVACEVKDGVLYADPNTVSLWDFIDQLDLDDHTFDLEACSDKLGIDSLDFRTEAYVKNNGLGVILDFIPSYDGSTAGLTNRYENLFENMIQDLSATDASMEHMSEQLEIITNLNDAAKIVLLLIAPELAIVPEILDLYLAAGSAGVEYGMYCNLFVADNEQKISMLDSLIARNQYEGTESMINAARNIRSKYQDAMAGVMDENEHLIMETLEGQVDFGMVADLISLSWAADSDLYERWDWVGPYLTLASIAKQTYEEGIGAATYKDLQQMLNHGMLYLYSVEQNYRTMAEYIIKTADGTMELLQEFIDAANAAEDAYGQLLDAYMVLEYDALEYGLLRDRTKQYQALFENAAFYSGIRTDISSAAEMGMYLSAINEMGLAWSQWTVRDADRDGADELIIECDATSAESMAVGHASQIVLDPGDMLLGAATFGAGASGDCYLVQSADGEAFYISSGYYSSMNQASEYYTWTTSGWTLAAQSMTDITEDSSGNFLSNSSYWVYGETATQQEYDSIMNTLNPGGAAQFDFPDLTDQFLPGDPDALQTQLSAYMKNRSGCRMQETADIDGDGDQDYIYCVYGAGSFWMDYAILFESYNTLITSFRDTDVTVLIAETAEGGVRLRSCRVELSMNADGEKLTANATLENGVLRIGNLECAYQSDGSAFVVSQYASTPYILDLLGASPYMVSTLLEEYHEWGGAENGMAQGMLDGAMLSITYSEYYGASPEESELVELTVMPWDSDPVKIAKNLDTSMTLDEFGRNMPNNSWWSTLKAEKGYDGQVFGYTTECYYHSPANGKYYQVIATFDEESQNASLLYLTLRLEENIHPSILEQFD